MAAQPVSVAIAAKGTTAGPVDDDLKQAGTIETPSSHSPSDDAALTEEEFVSNPFLDPKIAEHYRALYEHNQYECRHVFDPDLEWSKREERKLVHKLDWHVALWACIMFFALNVDRSNLGQAVSDNMLPQLGLTTNDYNTG